MTDYVWAPITGSGSQADPLVWHSDPFNWNTGSFWGNASQLILGVPSIPTGTIPGSGTGNSQGPGLDSVGIVAGEVSTTALATYNFVAPFLNDPSIASNDYKVDLTINSGTVDLQDLLLASAFSSGVSDIHEFPTLDVEGAVLKIEGSIVNTYTVVFPAIGTQSASGGGTIDIGGGGTVEVAGSVLPDVVMNFVDGAHDRLVLNGVAVGQSGEFAGTIAGFVPGDTIDLTGVPFSVNNTESVDVVNNDLIISSGATTLATLNLSGIYTSASFHLQDDGSGHTAIVSPCFVEGTRISTERGQVAVEALRPGDCVPVLTGGKAQPVIWLGHRRVDCRIHPEPKAVWPVCLSAGAFGPGRPFHDLWLSPDHALFIGGALIPIRYLVNGRTIRQEPRDEVTYWHVELTEHSVLHAEGVPAESYLDTGNRSGFANGGPVMDLHPNFSRQVWEAKGCAPLVTSGPELAAARRRLLARASVLGHVTTDDPDICVLANGTKLEATVVDGRRWRFRLPRTIKTIHLVSRTWVPAHLQPDTDDTRTLGVAVSRLWLDRVAVALDHPALSSGWHAREADLRWTDGNASIAPDGTRQLTVEVSMAGSYWQDRVRGAIRAA